MRPPILHLQIGGVEALREVLRRAREIVQQLQRWVSDLIAAEKALLLDGKGRERLSSILATTAAGELPLLHERWLALTQLGEALRGTTPCGLVRAAKGSARRFVEALTELVPMYADEQRWERPQQTGSVTLAFHARAQLCASMLHSAAICGGFAQDVDELTVFSDERLPQMLRTVGIIAVSEDVADSVRKGEPIASGSNEELELRAATVWGAERLRLTLLDAHGVGALGGRLTAARLDFFLWTSAVAKEKVMEAEAAAAEEAKARLGSAQAAMAAATDASNRAKMALREAESNRRQAEKVAAAVLDFHPDADTGSSGVEGKAGKAAWLLRTKERMGAARAFKETYRDAPESVTQQALKAARADAEGGVELDNEVLLQLLAHDAVSIAKVAALAVGVRSTECDEAAHELSTAVVAADKAVASARGVFVVPAHKTRTTAY